jgi:hypothetical protein
MIGFSELCGSDFSLHTLFPVETPTPTPTATPAPNSDLDGDGWTQAAETAIGTGALDPCGNNGWPADLLADNHLTVGDINSFLFPLRGDGSFNKFGHAVPDVNDATVGRWNLLVDGAINIGDIGALNPGTNASTSRPPMFGGLPAIFTDVGNGVGGCPFPP